LPTRAKRKATKQDINIATTKREEKTISKRPEIKIARSELALDKIKGFDW